MEVGTIVSIVANVVLALFVYSFKQTIRVAILEAVANIAEKYQTKADADAMESRLREQIGLRNEIRAGFARFGVQTRGDDTDRSWTGG